MHRDSGLNNGQGSAWQLLLQFAVAEGPAGEYETVRRVAEAVRGLGLRSPQMDQIGAAITEALRKAARRGGQGQPDLPVTVRVWISDGYRQERSRSSASGKEDVRPAPGGWGFFIIQKHEEDPQAEVKGAHHLIELFLYQEGDHPREHRQT